MIKNYFKLAWRSLYNNKLIGGINIFGLATGLTAAILIMFWVQNELSFDKHYKNSDRIYEVISGIKLLNGNRSESNQHPYIMGEIAETTIPQIEKLTRLTWRDASIPVKVNDHVFYEQRSAFVDKNWFDVFDQHIISGDVSSFFANPESVIITATRAKELFGNTDPVNKMISIDSTAYLVRAVIEDSRINSSVQFTMLFPVDAQFSTAEQRAQDLGWQRNSYITFIKLRQGTDTSMVSSAISDIRKRYTTTKIYTPGPVSLVPLTSIHFEAFDMTGYLVRGNKKTVIIFSILAALVLFSACINYVNLTTARAAQRSKDVGIRRLIGAKKQQLFSQFFIESVVVTIVSIMLAILIVQLALPWFNSFTYNRFQLPVLQGKFWLLIGITAVAVIILNGIYPALLLSSLKPVKVLKGDGTFSLKHAIFRKALVVVQFSFSIALIAGTIILSRQIRFINERDLGFNRSNVFHIFIPYAAFGDADIAEQESITQQLRNAIAGDAAVNRVSIAMPAMGNVNVYFDNQADWPGKDKSIETKVSPNWADAAYFQLFELGLAEGRWLRDGPEDFKNVVINETAVKDFGLKSPVAGQTFMYLGDTGTIVGVVKDIQYKSMHEKIGPQIFKTNHNAGTYSLYIKPAFGKTKEALARVEKEWKQNFPGYPFMHKFVEESYAAMYDAEIRSTKLLSLFSLLAVAIACLGLLGLATFATEARSKEISIRKILGANVVSILKLLSKDFMKLIMIAAIIAFPVAWYFGTKWLETFAYKIEIGWSIFGIAGMAALIIAFATISVHAFRAATSSPVRTLRND